MGYTRRRDRRRRIAAVGAIVGVAALLAATLAASLGTGGPDGSGTSTAPTTTGSAPELKGAARELLSILGRARDATFHARYEATSPDVPGSTIRVEEWRKRPRSRRDSVLATQGRRLATRVISTPEGVIRCTEADDGPWQCRKVSDRPADLLSGIRDQLETATVTARDAVVDGRKVRCFTLEREGTTSELCATAAGVPVRVSSGGGTLRLVELSDEVPDEVFQPPVEPA